MGEGDVCVAVLSNVGEMETEKIQQKRDHQWLAVGSEMEPLPKKQAKEGSVDDEVDSCAISHSQVALVSVEQEPCAKTTPTDGVNTSTLNPSIEQDIKECSDELEPVQTTEALNHNMPNDSGEEPVQECLKVTEEQNCESKQETESLNYNGVNPSVEQPVTEGLDNMELDSCGEKHSLKASNDMETEPIVEQPVKECLNKMEVEPVVEQPVKECLNEMVQEAIVQKPIIKECLNGMALEPLVEEPIKECLNEMEPVKESPSEIQTESCGKMQPTEALNESKPEPSDSLHEMELDVSRSKQTIQTLDNNETEPPVINQALNNNGIEPSVSKQTTEVLNDTELATDSKKEVKEASNEDIDICSEVSNPNVSPRDNSSSFQTVNSQPDGKPVMKDQVVCGEITSSSSEGSSSQEEHHGTTNDTSHVVLEVPKHASTSSGIRKITFKFSKRKEDYDSQSQLSASTPKSMSNSFSNGTRKVPRLHEPGDSYLYPEAMTDKAVPEIYPKNVKKLLATGILEGAKVKYISDSGELIGIVKDSGYLCGCASCNFSNILRAHEFEEHAGGKTRHPNNYIYMENGKPVYSIIPAMRASPLSTVDEAIRNVAGSSVNEEFLQIWKGSLQGNMDRGKTDSNNNHMKLMNLYHSTTSCNNQTREDGSTPYYNYRKSFALEPPQTFVNDTPKERKTLFKKPRSHTPIVALEAKRNAEVGHKKRDNDLHRLLFMPNGLPNGTELAYYARGKKILEGYKQGNGIVCSHCDTEISPSQFEAHAGWAAKRQPYRHIYIPNGLTLHDIALLLANGQSIATSNSDDMCAVCGDRGELIICDGCPRAFHALCLGVDGVSSQDWNCPYCRDSIGSGRKESNSSSRPIVIRLTRVVKAREYETGGCVICRAHDFSVADFDDRTVMLCDQCEKEYHVGCLRESGRCDLKALPSDKWFCCDHCDMIHGSIQDVVVNGAALVSSPVLSLLNKKQGGLVADNEIRWRMLSGKSRFPQHLPLLSRAAAIFRECFDPIVATSGRDLIPVMVYGRNISGQEFGGIYCVVLMAGSVVVSAGLLRIFGREVAELPLVATSRQHQKKGYFQALFYCIEELLLSLGVELLVLPAAEEAESIWTNKLGFRKMSDDRYTQYSRDIQLTIFKGTSMLEKELHPPTL